MNRQMGRAAASIVVVLLFALVDCQRAHGKQRPVPSRVAQGYIQTVWTTEDGLPQNSVTAILQSRDGYLWLGTFGGLVRFDGVKFTVFTAGNTKGLESERILTLYEDRHGVLWIGTEHGGLTRYAQGAFTTYRMKDGLPSDKVLSLSGGDNEILWIGTEDGLVRLQSGRFQTYTTNDGLPHREVLALHQDRQGTLWIGTRGGLSQLTAEGFRTYTSRDGLPSNMVNVIREGRDQSLWIGTGNGVARLKDRAITRLSIPGQPIGGSRSLHEDEEQTLWVGSHDGLVLVQKNGQTSRQAIAQVWAIFEDREKNLWVGTNGAGLHRWRKRQLITYTRAMGLAGDNLIPITEDGEGSIWIGAQCEGLSQFKDGRFTTYTDKLGLHNRCVRTLLTDRDGSVWIGTVGEVAHFKDGVFTRYGPEQGLANAFLWSLYRDRQGTLWVGTGGGGLYRFDNGRFTTFRVADGLVDNDVRFITEDREGNLWIGTVGGLSRFKDGIFTNYTTRDGLSHNFIRAIHEDADGTLWIGTYGGGLNRFKGGRFTPITTRNGLFDDTVSRILEDDRGNFWMSSNRGIFRVSRKELNEFAERTRRAIISVTYGVSDGMESSECNGGGQPAGWKARDGKLWFPTIKGAVVVDPTIINETPPLMGIERLEIDKQAVSLWSAITAPPGSGNLEIHYTGLSFVASEKVRFRYQLEGYEREWIDAGARRIAYYTNIPPGRYRFRVMAMNNDGVWSESSADVEFTLRPHFYQTRWFYVLIGAALAVMGWGGYRLRVKQLERRTRLLEATVAERTAEVVEQRNRLEQANALLERANQDLLSIFNEWRSGVLATDEQERITFLNHTAAGLLNCTLPEVVGQPWEQVIPLLASDMAALKALASRPPEERDKLSIQLQDSRGHRYRMDIEVKDDPRDRRRKMFFLYDVSALSEQQALLIEQGRFNQLIGASLPMLMLYQQIQDLANLDMTVLIQGETGTGKELVARAIHEHSHRRQKPFIAVNCGGLTESLIESRLFGHRRGAFTGATADQEGFFEAADGGTLFLDEIGDLPLSLQTSLLRVLQEKEIVRLGETRPRKIDVRVIAATHRDLEQEVAAGRFRQDLLYRLRVGQIRLAPLRERREDIPLLVAWFLRQFSLIVNAEPKEVSQGAMQTLVTYSWPGNVRELRSAIEMAAARCSGPVIRVTDLPEHIT
ncbi:MAG: sigma 54-interacting transcriptional regulator, partial [Blastocatellia bacterium]|nr:sigma 54-interacting transcriptional regulator [Blastocatellia bacterium]